MTEAPQKATVEATVSQISRALNAGARMILEQPFGSDYIPNKYALDAWNRRADLPAAVTVKPMTLTEAVAIVERTEPAEMTADGDRRWTRRMAEALAYEVNERINAAVSEAALQDMAEFDGKLLAQPDLPAAVTPADALTAAQARIAELEAERDDWKAGFGKILSSVPLPDVLKASGTIGDTIDYIKKSLEGDAEAHERGRLQGLDEAAEKIMDANHFADDETGVWWCDRDEAVNLIETLKTKGQEQ